MKFGSIGRSLVRWLRPPATSVPPKIDIIGLEAEKNASAKKMLDRVLLGMISPGIETSVEHRSFVLIDGSLREVSARPGIKPPSDQAAEGWTWTAWKRELDAGALPGWAVCRFANRTGPDNAAFVFGAVRGSFGIWRQPFDVCAAGADSTEHILTCVTHLRSGLGIGIFADREVAAAAAEIADRVCPAWETLDPDDRVKWSEVHSRTGAAWAGIGVRHSEDSHCHDAAGGTYAIYTRSPESVMAGRPEKLS